MAGDKPYPQVPVGNKDHANAAVVIIGAGISGMCTAIDLVKRNNCRNFIILEKSAGVGGTWYDNKYPGCCCDVFSTLYSYSFAQNPDWTREYPGQEEILSYLVRVAQEYNLYQHVRFNTTVEEARWDDMSKKWKTRVKTAAGSKESEFNPEYEITSDFLVSGVGQLNQPKWPNIDGLESFAGKKMHSSRWDWSYDLTDKKIALIGNGCTAVQILPEITKVAKHITVFQRTPNWVVPRMDAPVSPLMRGVYKYLPPIRWRKRALQMDFRESTHGFVRDGNSDVSAMFQQLSKEMMETQLPNQPELWAKLTPKYNLGCKRIIISDDYFPALAQAHVNLETRKITGITANNVQVEGDNGAVTDASIDGFDLLICATGFNTVEFMHPIRMVGRNGRTLEEVWQDGAKAYLGVTVEDMPNFGMLYGPNSNLGHNSIILMIESQSRYINGLIKPVLGARRQSKTLSLRPKRDKLAAFNAELQADLKTSTFNDPNCNSWYKTESGVITNNWSGTVVDYQKKLERLYYADYDADGTGKEIVMQRPTCHVGRVREESIVGDRTLMALGVASTVAVLGGWLLKNPAYLKVIGIKA